MHNNSSLVNILSIVTPSDGRPDCKWRPLLRPKSEMSSTLFLTLAVHLACNHESTQVLCLTVAGNQFALMPVGTDVIEQSRNLKSCVHVLSWQSLNVGGAATKEQYAPF